MRQRLGQHFLNDHAVIQTILSASELSADDTALEIGPGKGALTRELKPRVKRLLAIELDDGLAQYLRKSGFEIVHDDFLKTNLDALISRDLWPIKVLGNLPYSITSPIFEKLLAWPGWRTGVFLIQKEVAERMVAPHGSRTFGILSLAVQLFAHAEIIRRVPPGAFTPPPDVESAVIRLRRRETLPLKETAITSYFDLAHAAFAHRRKTLSNSMALYTGISRPLVVDFLATQGVDSGFRAENLGSADYAKMAEPWSIFRRETKLTP